MNDTQAQSSSPAKPSSQPKASVALFMWRWFWRLALIASPISLWYCFYVPSNNIAWADSYTAAQEQSKQSGKPVILFFTGEWCVPCKIMKRNVFANDQVASLVNASFIPVTINLDDAKMADTVKHYNIITTPNTIITDSQGNVLQQKEGGMSKADFLELLIKSNYGL